MDWYRKIIPGFYCDASSAEGWNLLIKHCETETWLLFGKVILPNILALMTWAGNKFAISGKR